MASSTEKELTILSGNSRTILAGDVLVTDVANIGGELNIDGELRAGSIEPIIRSDSVTASFNEDESITAEFNEGSSVTLNAEQN